MAIPRTPRVRVSPAEQREKLMQWSRRNGPLTSIQARAILGCTSTVALSRLAELVQDGSLTVKRLSLEKAWSLSVPNDHARDAQECPKHLDVTSRDA